jgi:hypothetical protein
MTLKEALEAKIPVDGFWPSQLWKTRSDETKNMKPKQYIGGHQTIDTMNMGHASLFDMTSP